MARLMLLVILSYFVCLASPQQARLHRKQLTIRATADSGVVAYLSDGSAWEVRPENRAKVAAWPKGGVIGVFRTEGGEYAYRLVLKPGAQEGDIVSVKRLLRVR